MFGFRRRTPANHPGDEMGIVREVALVAAPDGPNIHRQRALSHMIGRGLQGYSGTTIGYDRGDPAMSFHHVLQSPSLPTTAMARIGRPADGSQMAPPPEITDIVMSDPALDPYQALLYARIAR